MLEPVLGSGEFILYQVNICMVFKIYVKNIMYFLSLMKFKVVWVEQENYLLIKILISHRTLFKLVKGAGGGIPLGGIIVGEKLCDVFSPGDHGQRLLIHQWEQL